MKRQALGEYQKVPFKRWHCLTSMWPSVAQLQDELGQGQPLVIWALKVLLNVCFCSWDRKIVRAIIMLSLKCCFDIY